MIRYVYIGNQIDLFGEFGEGKPSRQFAFFETVGDSFLSFDGEYVFDSVEDFREWCDDDDLRKRLEPLIPQQGDGCPIWPTSSSPADVSPPVAHSSEPPR